MPPKPPEIEPVGVLAGKLNADQRQMLTALIRAYAGNMPPEIARAWLTEVQQSGDDIHFAWFGPADRNQPHGYLVKGATFLIEFNNTQNGANHIHSVWRSILGDFGLPALK